MNVRTLIFGAASALIAAVTTAHVVSQDRDLRPTPATVEGMMQRAAELAEPGEHHQRLDVMVGTWEQTIQWWPRRHAEAIVSKGTASFEWILGGRFMQGQYAGELAGAPFNGLELIGYDNNRQEYVVLWLDDMSTSVIISRGKFDEARNARLMSGRHDDIMTGQRDQPFRQEIRFDDEDTMIHEMFGPALGGGEYRVMRIRSVRKQ
jgi:hypothetical protein